jgi:tRNA-Thr(GGU) m(6)t(6)A37 methyltransferase TsaA
MDHDLAALDREVLMAEVTRLRAGIRAHRDSSAHELCWHHPQLWGLLPEDTDPQPAVPAWPQFLRGCLTYRESLDRQLPTAPRIRGEFGTHTLRPIGWVESPLTDAASAPRQADEDAPGAWLQFEADVLEGLRNIRPGDEVILLTWLDRARRDVLTVHPRGDESRRPEGVFSTRSPHRPNPIGLHDVTVTAIEGARLQVRGLEALDGTPIIDVKPVLSRDIGRR